MPRRTPPAPRAGHIYERAERVQGDYLHTCTECGRKVANKSGHTPQSFLQDGDDLVRVQCSAGKAFETEDDAAAAHAKLANAGRARRRRTTKGTKRGKR